MRYIWILALLATACGNDDGWVGHNIECFKGCNPSEQPEDTEIVYVRGPAGQPGTSGAAGTNGTDGAQGFPGIDGLRGPIGPQGYSIVTLVTPALTCPNAGVTTIIARDANYSGALELSVDEQVQEFTICNGTDGANGTNGVNGTNGQDGQDAPPTAFTPVEIIDPCGDTPTIYDEVLLRLADGSVLASFSDNANGQNTRFSLLKPGSFMTTDGSGCYFSFDGTDFTW